MSRRKAREQVLKALYAYELGGGRAEHIQNSLVMRPLSRDDKALSFATRLFRYTTDEAAEVDEIISDHATNWDLNRTALIDRLILRIAVCELLYFEDIPPKVSINEAIEVAKEYSTDQSPSFVNGVLDAALADLQREGRLKKSGRGLVGMDSTQERGQ